MYIQQDATLHSLLYLETALHVSGGTSTHHQERMQLYLQHLVFVTPLLLPAAIAVGSSNDVTNTRCCRYSCMRSWWWAEVPPKTCRLVSRYNKLCNVASCWIYIGILCVYISPSSTLWSVKFSEVSGPEFYMPGREHLSLRLFAQSALNRCMWGLLCLSVPLSDRDCYKEFTLNVRWI